MCNEHDKDLFRYKFKYFKSKKHEPSLNEVILAGNCVTGFNLITNKDVINDPRTELIGLKPYAAWNFYSLESNPGLLFIRNPFTALGQRYWIRKCLEKYPQKPNKLNIDIEMRVNDWWAECFNNGSCNKILQKKLRWTTLGYHHNWDTKVYSEDSWTEFPVELAELTDIVAQYLGYQQFKAEAAIVNYYHMGSTLSAHTDHSEIDLEAPLFSYSFGQSAIFLIGGLDKSIDPTAILIQSGDIVIMTKEARLCYHAVPKILPTTNCTWEIQGNESPVRSTKRRFKYLNNSQEIIEDINTNIDNKEWSRYKDYISESRINMNVRQVLKENQKYIMV